MRVEPTIWEGDSHMPATWRVLTALLKNPSLSQAELRAKTGLSHPVIVQQVARLRRVGLISLGQPISGRPGRPRIPLTFNWDYRRLLAVEVHRSGITVQATNLAGEAICEPKMHALSAWTPHLIRKTLSDAIKQAIWAGEPPCAGVGIVIPGAVAADGVTVLEWMDLPAWQGEALGTDLSADLNLPVLVMNDAVALARALWSEYQDGSQTILAISLRHPGRIGTGLIVDGQLLYNVSNNTGGIGHLPAGDRACACGRGGCLETLFSAAHEDVILRPQAVRVLAEAVSTMAMVMNPDKIVLQGDEAWGAADSDLLQQVLTERSTPQQAFAADIRANGASESLNGALSLLAGHLLSFRGGQLAEWATPVTVEPDPLPGWNLAPVGS